MEIFDAGGGIPGEIARMKPQFPGYKVAAALAVAGLAVTFIEAVWGSRSPCGAGGCERPAEKPAAVAEAMPVVFHR